jgi:chemotaxis protein CheY-P-specific phosphatase CheC
MLNGNSSNQVLTEAFESGYLNAAKSLSMMVNDQVYYEPCYQANHFVNSFHVANIYPWQENNNESYLLLTTEIFGDVFGKSYLILSQHDFDVLTRNINQSKDPNVNFHHEFLKEVDNILSAAVITKLSNKLKMKMYGDIPMWVGAVQNNVAEIISADFQDRVSEVYVNTIMFTFDKAPTVKPLFIWIMDSRVGVCLEESKVVS